MKSHELVALPLELARELLGEAAISIVETMPPRWADLVEGGQWRVLRARETEASQTEGAWELTVAREQMREQRHNEQRQKKV